MNILNNLNNHKLSARKLFLIDSAGALVTALLTGVLLPNLQPPVGLPPFILNMLGVVAFIYSLYSFLNFYFFSSNWPMYLAAIAVANLLYCILSLVFVFYFRESLSALGFWYFMLETIVLVILVSVEWRVSKTRVQ